MVKDDITPDTFSTFHNTATKLADRALMLEGKWPSGGCDYCAKIETAGGGSDRQLHLKIPNLVPPELDTNINAVSVTPRIVEVYFDNTCNLKCVYCRPTLSSKIQQENQRYGKFDQNSVVIEAAPGRVSNHSDLVQSFWSWLGTNYNSIRRLHILGGEPFYQQEFDQCLEFLSTNRNRQLEFNVISNLMISPDRFRQQIERIHKIVQDRLIGRFELTASIDCWGPEQEYIRTGLDLDIWRQNFEYLVTQKWITLNINQVISVLSVPSMLPLIEYINQHRLNREIGHFFIKNTDPTYLDPDIIGEGYFDKHFADVINCMSGSSWQQQQACDYMHGIWQQIKQAKTNVAELSKMKTYLDEIDRRRSSNWTQVFPWLSKILETHNVV